MTGSRSLKETYERLFERYPGHRIHSVMRRLESQLGEPLPGGVSMIFAILLHVLDLFEDAIGEAECSLSATLGLLQSTGRELHSEERRKLSDLAEALERIERHREEAERRGMRESRQHYERAWAEMISPRTFLIDVIGLMDDGSAIYARRKRAARRLLIFGLALASLLSSMATAMGWVMAVS